MKQKGGFMSFHIGVFLSIVLFSTIIAPIFPKVNDLLTFFYDLHTDFNI